MKNKILLFIIAFFTLIPSTNALMCDNSKKIYYQELAQNISVNYEYVEANDDVTFTIKFSNIPDGFTIYDFYNNVRYEYQGPELIIPAEKNKSYKFNVYTNNVSCYLENLYNHYVTIPSYNKYYKDELCKGIEDYKLCSKWLNVTISYDEWKEQIIKYRNSFNIEKEQDNVFKKTLFDKIVDFYVDYYIVILISLIVISCVGIYLYNRKHDLF